MKWGPYFEKTENDIQKQTIHYRNTFYRLMTDKPCQHMYIKVTVLHFVRFL